MELQFTIFLLLTSSAYANEWFGTGIFANFYNSLQAEPPAANDEGQVVSNQYFVEFDDSWNEDQVNQAAQEAAAQVGGIVKHVYTKVLKGALIVAESSQARSYTTGESSPSLRGDVHGADKTPKYNLIPDVLTKGDAAPELRVQQNPPSGLDRIDQRGLPLDGKFQSRWDGSGVNIYIFDTGIRSTHHEFDERPPICGYDAFGGNGGPCNDNFSHGTHVSGTAAGRQYGVAKNATVYSVKVLDDWGNGSFGAMIAGLDWVVGQKELYREQGIDQPMVVNLSLGGSQWDPADRAVNAAVDAGVVVVVAAGNNMSPACWESPASASKAITVAASETKQFFWFWTIDKQAWYSNWGNCVDLYAPGSGIVSATIDSDDATSSRDGTSHAAPHVAGAAALVLQQDPTASPDQVKSTIMDKGQHWALAWWTVWFAPNILLNIDSI